MSTSPIVTITDELLAEIEKYANSDAKGALPVRSDVVLALLARIADLKQKLVAAGITAENCELFRKDAERYQWLRDDAEFADFETLCLTSLGEWGAYIDAARSAGGGS